MDRELIAYFDERFRELREETTQHFEQLGQRVGQLDQRVGQLDQRVGQIDQRVGQLDQRVGQLDQRVGRVEDTAHGTRILVEDLRGKIELVAEGVVGVSERLDASRKEHKQEMKEIRDLFTSPIKNLDGRVQVVEERTTRHTREIAALRRRPDKPRTRPS